MLGIYRFTSKQKIRPRLLRMYTSRNLRRLQMDRSNFETRKYTLFYALIPHRSGPNKTDLPRRAIYLTFNSAAEGDLRKKYYLERDQFLAKLQTQKKQISTIGHFEGKILN